MLTVLHEARRYSKEKRFRNQRRRVIEIDGTKLSFNQLSINFINRLSKRLSDADLDALMITQRSVMDEDFIRRHSKRFNWAYLTYNPYLHKRIIDKFSDKIPMFHYVDRDNIDWAVIAEYCNKINWVFFFNGPKRNRNRMIPQYILDVLAEKIDKGNAGFWENVSQYTPMSSEFINKYSSMLSLEHLKKNPYIIMDDKPEKKTKKKKG